MEVTEADDRGRPLSTAVDIVEVRFVTPAADLAGLVRVDVRRDAGATRFVAAVSQPHRRNVVVVDHDLPPAIASFELRAPGIWTELVCERPLDHWTVGLEAFGLALDAEEVASPQSRGDRVPVGLDLDLDTVDAPLPVAGGFDVAVRVHGEVLVADARFDVDARGVRSRRWDGRRPVAGPADDGPSGPVPVPHGSLTVEWPAADGLPPTEGWRWFGGETPGWVSVAAQSA